MTPALPWVVSLALGATVSTSKLGVVFVGTGTGAGELLAACPRAIEAVQPTLAAVPPPTGATTATGALLASYAQGCAGGQGILVMAPMFVQFPTALTAAGGDADAVTYWVSAPTAFNGVSAGNVRWVAAAPNLFDVVNPNVSTAHADYANAFAARLAQLVRQDAQQRGGTYSLLLPRWSSTTPGAFCATLQAALAGIGGTGGDPGVAWTWRATSASLSSTVADEAQTTFGYRAVSQACAAAGHPIFVELDAAGGWLGGGARTPTQVIDWFRFVDQTAAADADVAAHGAFLLRNIGASTVDDLSGVAPQLAAYLANPSGGGGGGGGTPGSGTDGGTSGGTPVVPLGDSGGRSTGGCGLPAGGASLAALALAAAAALRLRAANALRRRR